MTGKIAEYTLGVSEAPTRKRVVVGLACAGAFILLGLGPQTAESMVRRHDRADALYRVDPGEFPTFVDVMGQVGGTLIHSEWVLTAAHNVEDVDPLSDWRVYIDGKRYDVEKIVIHPRRERGDVNSDFDIAMLKLDRPVTGITPTPLYRWKDEVHQVATFVGRGGTGVGLPDGVAQTHDHVLRRAKNKIETATEHSITFVFDAPPAGLDLEGSAGARDSGGPAFLERDGVRYLAGVASTNSASGLESARYGTVDSYGRVSTHAAWIDEVLATDPASTLTDWPDLTRRDDWSDLPETSAGLIARAFFGALNADSLPQMVAFMRDHGSRASQATPEARAANWMSRRQETGPQTLYGFTQLDDRRLTIVTRGAGGQWLAYMIETDPEDPRRIAGFLSGGLSGPPHGPADDAPAAGRSR